MNKNTEIFLDKNISELSDIWDLLPSVEQKSLMNAYQQYGDKIKATEGTLGNWKTQFGDSSRKIVEVGSDRDVYKALKDLYDKTGSMDMVIKTAAYNEIPQELVESFIDPKTKQFKETLKASGAERAGALARGALDNLYGGFLNTLTAGKYANKYWEDVPEGIESKKAVKTYWGQGAKQAEAYGKALKSTSPGVEMLGQGLGMVAPTGLAAKATKGIKFAKEGSKLARLGEKVVRGGATGALTSIPGSLSQDSVEDAIKNTALEAALFAGGEGALGIGGELFGAGKKFASQVTGKVLKPSARYTESFAKVKPVSEMSREEIARGMKEGWLSKDKKLNVSKYLADTYGMDAKETMGDLWKASFENKNVYKQLRGELENFHYIDEVKKLAKDSIVPRAPLSRVNQILKSIPQRLEQFIEGGAKNYESLTGERLMQSMSAFNADVKYALNNLKGLSPVERRAVEKYLKKLEATNMLEMMKKSMPSRFSIHGEELPVVDSLAKIFNINNKISVGNAISNMLSGRQNRKFMEYIMRGEKMPKPHWLQRLLEYKMPEKTSQALSAGASMTQKGVIKTLKKEVE